VAKRGERVAPPPRSGEWDLRHTGDSTDGWEELCKQAPGAARAAYDQIVRAPLEVSKRQHQLKGELATVQVRDRLLPQWQYEVTGAGRVWYAADAERRLLHMTLASVGHPKETE
jgi:hypothetical protein